VQKWRNRDAIWDLDLGGPKEACIGWGAHLRNVANIIKMSTCGGDVACCQITLTTCCIVVYWLTVMYLQCYNMQWYLSACANINCDK